MTNMSWTNDPIKWTDAVSCELVSYVQCLCQGKQNTPHNREMGKNVCGGLILKNSYDWLINK